jgi:hypothetical protein
MELPIFTSNLRSSASWKELLDQAQEQWRQASASADRREQLLTRARLLQLLHTFRRAGRTIDEREAALLALQPDELLNQSEAARFVRATRLVTASAAEAENRLTRKLLADLYRTLAATERDTDAIRTTETLALNPAHSPVPAVLLSKMIDNALDWFTTDSFNELHIGEQAALVYLRLLDLQLFPTHHETIALLAASFFTERAGLPPLIIFSDELTTTSYPAIVESAFRMLTQPLVELLAANLIRTTEAALQ